MASGEVAEGVLVRVEGPYLQGSREAITDQDGFFQILALPPGNYSARMTRMGVRSTTVEGVSVSLGETTSLGNLTLDVQPVSVDPLVVQASGRHLDPVHTTVGATLKPEELALIPADRDYRSVIQVLPHVTESSRGDAANVGGQTGPESMYFIDGMNATSPLVGGAEATSLPYNFVRSVEVKVGGYEAQYGKALGAVVNAVTYSGTNQREIDVFGFFTNSALAADGRAEPTLRTESFRSYDVGARLGGPILMDRLWYSAAYNPRIDESDREIAGLGLFPDRRVAHVFAGKLTWQVAPQVNLEASLLGDPTVHDMVAPPFNVPLSPANPDPYLARRETGSITGAVRATATFGSRWLLEGALSRSTFRERLFPRTARGRDELLVGDWETGRLSGGYPQTNRYDMGRTAVTLRATLSLNRHTVLGGAEFEDAAVDQDLGFYVIQRYSPTSFSTWKEATSGTTRNRVPTLYLQDSWRATERLTLNAGLRWSNQYLVGQGGGMAQEFSNEWQPRLGFVYQLGEPGTQRLFGSYGRFYQNEPGNLAAINYKDYVTIVGECSSDPREPGAECEEDNMTTSAFQYAHAADGLDVENLDEFTLGYERSFGEAVSVTLRGLHRKLRSSFQWGFLPDPETGHLRTVLGTPGKRDFDFLPPPKRAYSALEGGIVGRWWRTDYRMSYVLSRTWGNYTGFFSSDGGDVNPGGNGSFEVPHQAENSTGLLPNDHTHVFKVMAAYRTDRGLSLGSFLTWQSGSPLNEFGAGPSGVLWRAFLVPRGTAGRSPNLWNLDLRLAYDVPWQAIGQGRIILDALHVGNPQRPTWLDEVHYGALDEEGRQTLENNRYLKPLAYQPPMTLRLGFEIRR